MPSDVKRMYFAPEADEKPARDHDDGDDIVHAKGYNPSTPLAV